jgi:ADP-ribosylglycohydrolase
MIGAIAGDIIGSVYESPSGRGNIKTTVFPLFDPRCRFTDDTVLSVALADSILTGADYVPKLKEYYRRYPRAGFSSTFSAWARSDRTEPYNAFSNGAAMRVSPVGYAYDTLDEVLARARDSAAVTHNHPEGIKGAQATASAIFLARTGRSREEIRTYIETTFGYALDRPLDEIRKDYRFDVSCQGSVPQAITAFLESHDFEDAVRKAVSIGGDSDTIACIAGGIAQAFYQGVPGPIVRKVFEILDDPLTRVVGEFATRYGCLPSPPS